MLFLTLKTIFVSLLLIALIHYLYGFFKNTLTVPKVKDLVNKPAQRYNEMFASIHNENNYTTGINEEKNVGQQSMGQQSIGQQSMGQQSMGQQNMQAELKNFLNELKKPNTQPIMQTNASTNASTNVMQSAKEPFNDNLFAANETAFSAYTQF